MTTKYGTLIIYQSLDCEVWEPVPAADVPAWTKDPEVLGRMVDGEACRHEDAADSTWFIAKRVLSPKDQTALQAAQARRERHQRIRLLHEQPQGEQRIAH